MRVHKVFVLHIHKNFIYALIFSAYSYKKTYFMYLWTFDVAIGDVKKEKAPVNDTDELPKHAKNEGLGERFPEMAEILAQFDELKNQMEDTMAENQPLINTHDDASNDSAATTATSEEAGAEWHAKFCSFKQQTQEKFEEQAKAIHDLEQLIHDSNKIKQIPNN